MILKNTTYQWNYSRRPLTSKPFVVYTYTLVRSADAEILPGRVSRGSWILARYTTNKRNPHYGSWSGGLAASEIYPERFNYHANINEAKAYFEILARLSAS